MESVTNKITNQIVNMETPPYEDMPSQIEFPP